MLRAGRNSRWVAALSVLSAAVATASAAPRYSVIELPFNGSDVNNAGYVAGVQGNQLVRWRPDTGTEVLTDIDDGLRLFPAAMTDNGMILGGVSSETLQPCGHSTLWTSASGLQFICDPEFPVVDFHGGLLHFRDINGHGVAAGVYRDRRVGEGGVAVPVAWDEVRGIRELESLTPGGWSDVVAINEAGWIAGNSDLVETSLTVTRATLWSPDGAITNLGVPEPAYTHSGAIDINDQGYVAVMNSTDNANESWLWHADTGFQPLGGLPGAPPLHRPVAINNHNQVVGVVFNEPDGGWLWSAEDGMLRISDLLDSESAGWRIDDPIALNDHGWIVASGRYKNFPGTYPILLTPLPPTPAGDANGDGAVDITDLNLVRNNFGLTGDDVAGDTNDDGAVDIGDLNAVRNNFGATAGAAAVPEPASAEALLVAFTAQMLMFLPLRRRRDT